MNTNNNVKRLLKTALVAAIYVAVTVVIAPIAYGPLQFRLSEVLILLVLIDPLYIPGLTLGCAISNFLLSPMAFVDVVVGTSATLIALVLIWKTKELLIKKYGESSTKIFFISSIWATIVNGLLVGAELYYVLQFPFWLSVLQVAIGEFVVVSVIGVLVFKIIIKNKSLCDKLKIE
ncbi:MAG: QueT transporter family protein [Clostridium sp.]|uniref:QueT transporter family protein n=1 Tax=Clostridium sp. TaxID=1506 RepID=UPI0030746A4F